MQLEVLAAPHHLEDVKQLVEEDDVFLLVNVWGYLEELYKKAHTDAGDVNFNDCWKLKPLKKLYEHSRDPEMFLQRMTHEHFIRIVN